MASEVQSVACIFCELEAERKVAEFERWYVIRDGFPVTALHTLIIPKRHVVSFFELENEETNDLNDILRHQQGEICNADKAVAGFNIGVNIGTAAGQTIMHCHVHLIPRRADDVVAPRGGVRGVIPAKQDY